MSEFKSMTIVVGRDLPRFNIRGGHYHTITVDQDHDAMILADVIDRFDRAGYELLSVIVDGYDFAEEMVKHVRYMSNVPLFFEALQNDKYQADVICAFITVDDCADVESWHDRIIFYGPDYESVVLEWSDTFDKVYQRHSNGFYDAFYTETSRIPSWASVDWEDALNTIARDNSSAVIEFGGSVFYISND